LAGDLSHAGAAYNCDNLRFHVYIDSPLYKRDEGFTYFDPLQCRCDIVALAPSRSHPRAPALYLLYSTLLYSALLCSTLLLLYSTLRVLLEPLVTVEVVILIEELSGTAGGASKKSFDLSVWSLPATSGGARDARGAIHYRDATCYRASPELHGGRLVVPTSPSSDVPWRLLTRRALPCLG
jgi:hypothetical protein